MNCPRCGSDHTKKDGVTYLREGKRQSYQCIDCRRYFNENAHPVITGGSDEPKVEPRPTTPEDMVKALQDQGYTITKEAPKQDTYQVFSKRFDNLRVVKFAAFSCSHLGSRYQQLSALNSFYDRAKAEGCSHVLCAGDIFDGNGKVYRGQEYEVFKHGYDVQLAYGIEHFPLREGIRTIAIAGNHDTSFYASGGADIVQSLSAARPDITYLGQYGGTFQVDKDFKVFLMHGKGGMAYARSYKMQRIIEGFTPENKPHMLLLGHWHTFAHLPMYRNVVGWMLGCFQSQTPFEKTLGLSPEVGGIIFTIKLGGKDRVNGTVEIGYQTTLVPYYVPVENDWNVKA